MPAPKKRRTKRPKRSRPTPGWQLQAAKARFSEVIRLARTEGPQVVTKQGRKEVVILAYEEFQHLTARERQPESLVEFFARSPLAEAQIDLVRKSDYGRMVEL